MPSVCMPLRLILNLISHDDTILICLCRRLVVYPARAVAHAAPVCPQPGHLAEKSAITGHNYCLHCNKRLPMQQSSVSLLTSPESGAQILFLVSPRLQNRWDRCKPCQRLGRWLLSALQCSRWHSLIWDLVHTLVHGNGNVVSTITWLLRGLRLLHSDI